MAFDSQTVSLAIAIVAICMTLYLYRKTSTELQELKSRPPIMRIAKLPPGAIPQTDGNNSVEKCDVPVKKEEDEA